MISITEILTLAGFDGDSFKISDTSGNSYRGICPNCGGSRRLLVFVDNNTPFWNHQCDICGYKSKILGNLPVEYHGIKAIDTNNGSKVDKQALIDQLNNNMQWLQFHNNLTEENRAWYRERGVPDEYQNKWLLGYTDKKAFIFEEQRYHSRAYTIPKVNLENTVVNVDYRLLEFPEKAGKYRSESGLLPAAFIADTETKSGSHLFVVEGAFKAMVLYLFLKENEFSAQVIGLPAASSKLYLDFVPHYETSFVMLDPDALKVTKKTALNIGYTAKPVFLPSKIDDAILGGMSWTIFTKIIENSDL